MMRVKFLLIRFIVFCLVFGVVSLKPFVLNAQNQEVVMVGELCVFAEPENDADVFIDGIFVGHTPFLKKVEIGSHELVVKKEMYYDYEQTVTISDARVDIKVDLKPKFGMLRIDTKPVGARVSFNGIDYPTLTPCISGKLMGGGLIVKIELEEYKSVDTIILINEGKVTNLKVKLEKKPVFECMTRDEYNYQLNRVYKTNEDGSIVDLDTVNDGGIAAVYQKSSSHAATTIEWEKGSGIRHGLWIKGGLGLSNVYGKGLNGETINWSNGDYYSVYPTYYVGVQYTARFCRYVGLAADLNFSKTGYQYCYGDTIMNYAILNKYTFNKIELPIVARAYYLKNGCGPMIELGGIMNYGKNCKVNYTLSTGEQETVKEKYGSFNFGLVGGLGYDFMIESVTCSVNARVVMEMTNVFNDVNYKLIYFQFGIGIKIM